ncbi:hypothetical protein QA601_02500 [Chitinispirillales bacterium ANBcel5]|uniref:hypothetical protein n=1 Tax=Cellulosispirillum alkaliphilum TaxID=3039283 RepID=UPI002A55E6D9|nr:hypothetical protein [Chitinispirillales bacterium ANBcel5]
MFYNTRKAYEESWDLKKVDWIIQVKAPSRGNTSLKSDDAKTVFEDNWHSTLIVEITNVRDDQLKREVHTTQGRLYNALRFGDISLIEETSPEPSVPLGVENLFEYLDLAKEHFLQRMPKTVENPNLFVVPINILSSVTTLKYSRALRAMRKIGNVSEFTLTLKECGIANWEKFNPML